jgi:hypothetical protein
MVKKSGKIERNDRKIYINVEQIRKGLQKIRKN